MPVHKTVSDGVGRIIWSNPPVNVLTRDLLGEIRDALEELSHDPALRVLVISGEGRHFSAGASVEEHLPPHAGDLIPEFMMTVRTLNFFPLPVIAAVQGRCLGGGLEMALAADMVVAEASASFGQPEIRLGVFPPAACALLPILTSRGVAARLVYTGDALSAREARAAGIVTEVVQEGALEQAVQALAHRIARNSGAALRIAKQTLRDAEPERMSVFHEATTLYVESLMDTSDALEGLHAFLEKRAPVWSHQ